MFTRWFACLLCALTLGSWAQADPVIWDNGADALVNVYASQLDSQYPFDAQVADDFLLPLGPQGQTQWTITDVHWNGGYWNGTPAPFDFRVLFYTDNGTGNAPTGGPNDPTATALYVADFLNSQVNETFTGGSLHYSYSVILPNPLVVDAGSKYWLAVQAVGIFPPQWGLAESAAQQLHGAVQGFPDLGKPYWSNLGNLPSDAAADVSFQLTGYAGSGIPEPATAGLLLLGAVGLLRRRR